MLLQKDSPPYSNQPTKQYLLTLTFKDKTNRILKQDFITVEEGLAWAGSLASFYIVVFFQNSG